ncbi:twin-arginine translocase subunit TatB [Spongiibacter sp. KMU-158]|uniref:Sec-independent protein translocase protein TatB n=1 Tax=Spongiibacter pelagi TaxID=2760804 RepID=A0A927GW15_9GAMM|nr:Sec-independent protein translocase protein TatB [Spongiibacter pelagi]MBD2857959.1 twin-arginine translocase subunit TatB [Spongiibacter pelagi]
MFDMGFGELLLIAVVGLLVIGPERLPGTIRTISLWLGRFRRSFNEIRSEIEREVGADEIRRQLHNEQVMASLKESEKNLQSALESTTKTTNDALQQIGNSIMPPEANATDKEDELGGTEITEPAPTDHSEKLNDEQRRD